MIFRSRFFPPWPGNQRHLEYVNRKEPKNSSNSFRLNLDRLFDMPKWRLHGPPTVAVELPDDGASSDTEIVAATDLDADEIVLSMGGNLNGKAVPFNRYKIDDLAPASRERLGSVKAWEMSIDRSLPLFISIAEFSPSPRVLFPVIARVERLRSEIFAIDHQQERYYLYQ